MSQSTVSWGISSQTWTNLSVTYRCWSNWTTCVSWLSGRCCLTRHQQNTKPEKSQWGRMKSRELVSFLSIVQNRNLKLLAAAQTETRPESESDGTKRLYCRSETSYCDTQLCSPALMCPFLANRSRAFFFRMTLPPIRKADSSARVRPTHRL